VISELNSPVCTPPVNASPPSYEEPTHDSGPWLVANHYHAGDFHPLLFAGFYRRFRLDPLIYHHTNTRLIDWLKICPKKQFNTLDTHDGLGVGDVAGLMTQEKIDRVIEKLYEKEANTKIIYSSADYNNMDIYQVNCTYYSALECNDNAYLAARAIQFYTPGIPLVYYVGLLAGKNDIRLVEETLNGRDINRHNYNLDEIHEEIQKPVVRRLIKLMEFRNTYPAFDGELTIEDCKEKELILSYEYKGYKTTASIDLESYQTKIEYYDKDFASIKEFIA